ncbi:hypothetical protein SAMN05444397_10155 [Flavobacterium aquidurense]|uniref:YD repeat-containing protein n=1 Tax=Flavobacterium frigidimaris TaxID=262320 RepID=A0ABX4BLS4_FLAFR|nr:hypothetical protein [Flavobacterium frigidimaris]OXA76331.1 hypothetical protein B0A65_19320 [Flavobacterium frigidimaris]SDY21254.1 hypothetical protein SAMN05444397_10155 [Flavobacterium aquidurense]
MNKIIILLLLILVTLPINAQKVNFPKYPIYNEEYGYVVQDFTNTYEDLANLKDKNQIKTLLQNILLFYTNKYHKSNTSHTKLYFSNGKVQKNVIFYGITEDTLYAERVYRNDTLVNILEFDNNQDLGYGSKYTFEKGKLVKTINNHLEKNRKRNNYSKYNNGINTTEYIFKDNALVKIENMEQAAGYPRVNVEYLYHDKDILEVKYIKQLNSIAILSLRKITNEEENVFNYSYARVENLLVENIDYNFLMDYLMKNTSEKVTKKFDASGNLIFEKENSSIQKKIYLNDLIKEIKFYDNKNIESNAIKYTYNKQNQILERVEVQKNGSLDRREQNTYNAFGDLITEKIELLTDNKPFHTSIYIYQYVYDKHNNWIEKKKFLSKEPMTLVKRTIEYTN